MGDRYQPALLPYGYRRICIMKAFWTGLKYKFCIILFLGTLLLAIFKHAYMGVQEVA